MGPPDCGPVPEVKLFSHRKARFMREQQHPGERLTDANGQSRVKPYPLLADLGDHVDREDVWWLWRRLTCRKQPQNPPEAESRNAPLLLAKHGLGVVLYFKFMKFMAYVLCGMSFLALPALIFYIQGSAYGPTAKGVLMKEDGLAGLFFTTLGSLGEGSTACQKRMEHETLSLVCPSGVISSVTAYYGHPKGDCHCPAAQKPLGEEAACPNPGNFIHLGRTKLGELCCVERLNAAKTPDMTSVDVAPYYGCNSGTAGAIVQGLCVGRSNCTLAVEGTKVFSWDAVGGEAPSDCDTDGRCRSSFMARGNFSLCSRGRIDSPRTLIVQVTCKPGRLQMGLLSYRREDIVTGMACLDALAIILFLYSLYYLGKKERKDRDAINGQVCTAADYTVKVTNLPSTSDIATLSEELHTHFEKVLSQAKPVKQSGAIHVADINIARSDAEIIRTKKERGAAARRVDRAAGELRLLRRFRPNELTAIRHKELQLELATSALEAASWDVEELTAKHEGGKARPVAAFVTFETEEGVARALRVYPDLGVLRPLVMPKRLLFYDRALCVERAAEPASILWENLVPASDQPYVVLRRLFTVGISIVVLVVSFALVWKAQQEQTAVSLKYPQVSCTGYKVDLSSAGFSPSPYVLTRGSVERDVYWDYYGQSQGDTGKLQCFCRGALQQRGLRALNLQFSNPETGGSEKLCMAYVRSQALVTSLLILASVAIVLVNCTLQAVLRSVTAFERHASKAQEVMSLSCKLFIVSFFNTALLTLLTYANFSGTSGAAPPAGGLRSKTLSLFNGPFNDLNEGWYRVVGVSLALTMAINVFSPHVSTLTSLLLSHLRRCWDRRCGCDPSITRVATQKDLEALYVGPAFALEERYAQVLTTLFVTLLFAGAIPLLLPLAALALALSFCIDKLAFFRLYRAPAPLDDKIAVLARRLLPYAALLHLGFSAWAMTSPTQFSKSLTTDVDLACMQSTLSLSSPSSLRLHGHAPVGNTTASSLNLTPHSFGVVGDEASAWARVFDDPKALPLVLVGLLLGAHLCLRLIKALLGGPLSLLDKWVPLVGLWFRPEFEWQSLQPYFHAIPTERLEYAISVGVAKPEFLARYQAELERRQRGGGLTAEGGRVMEGLETYDYSCNAQYLDAFALDSEALRSFSSTEGGKRGQGEARGHRARGPLMHMLRGLLRAIRRLPRSVRGRYEAADKKKDQAGSEVRVLPPMGMGAVAEHC